MLLEPTYDAELPPQVEVFLKELSSTGAVQSRVLRSFLTCDEVYVVSPSTERFSGLVQQLFQSQTGVDGLRALFREAIKRTNAAMAPPEDKKLVAMAAEDMSKSKEGLTALRAATRQRRCACALWHLCFLITEVALGLGLGPCFGKVFQRGPSKPLVRTEAAAEVPLGEDVALDVSILKCCLETIIIDFEEFLGSQARGHLQKTEVSWLERGLTFALGLPTFENDADTSEAAASLYDLQLIATNLTLLLLSMCDEPAILQPQSEGDWEHTASSVGFDCLDAIMLVGDLRLSRPVEQKAQELATEEKEGVGGKHGRKTLEPNVATKLASIVLQRLVRRPQPPMLRSRVKYILRQRQLLEGSRFALERTEEGKDTSEPDGSLAATALNVLSLGLFAAPQTLQKTVEEGSSQPRNFPGRMAYTRDLGDAPVSNEAGDVQNTETLVERGSDGTFTVVISETPLGLSLEQRYVRGEDGNSRQCIFRVNEVIEGGAAGRTGHIRVGDRLLGVNNVSTEEMSLEECGELIRSMVPDTPLTLRFLRRPAEEGVTAVDAESVQSWEEIGATREDGVDADRSTTTAAQSGGWLSFLGFGGEDPKQSASNDAAGEDGEEMRQHDARSVMAMADMPVEDIPRLAAIELPPVGSLSNPETKSPLTDQSLMLLLLLLQYHAVNRHGDSDKSVGEVQSLNPFRAALASLRDVSLPKNRREMQIAQEKARERGANSTPGGVVDLTVPNWIVKEKVAGALPSRASPETLMLAYCARGNFDGMIQEICGMLQNEEMFAASLLLYSLMQSCSAFVEYIRCSCDGRVALLIGSLIEAQFHVTLSLSGLRNGFLASKSRESQISQFRVHISNLYVLVIDTLILVQDVAFCRAVFSTMDLPEATASWISAMCRVHPLTRTLNPAAGSMNCGSALLMVTLVMLKFNLAQASNDTYLQSNLFALLLNLCSCAENLSSQVAQRFFSFLLATIKDYKKISNRVYEEIEKGQNQSEEPSDETPEEGVDRRLPQLIQSADMVEETVVVLLKGLVMMLRPRTLQDNVSVLYNYLLNAESLRELPEPLRIPTFGEEPREPLMSADGRELLQVVFECFHDDSQEPSIERITKCCIEVNDLIYVSRVQNKEASMDPAVARLLELDQENMELNNYVYEESEDASAFFRPQTWRAVAQRWPSLWSRLISAP